MDDDEESDTAGVSRTRVTPFDGGGASGPV